MRQCRSHIEEGFPSLSADGRSVVFLTLSVAIVPAILPATEVVNMPQVTFGEAYPTKRSYDDISQAVTKHTEKDEGKSDALVVRRTRTINYKIPEDKPYNSSKPAEENYYEKEIIYKDSCGNVLKITYEDACGRIIRTIYPSKPPKCRSPSPPPKCRSPSPRPKCCASDHRKCKWTKIVIKNSRGVIWKIVYVNCIGDTMKTKYPEPDPPKRRTTETRRYVIKEVDDSPPRQRRSSETKRIVVEKDFSEPPSPKKSSEVVKTETIKYAVEKEDAPKPREEYYDFFPTPGHDNATESSAASRRDSANYSSSKQSGEYDREVVKDENGVVRRVTYTDSRGRRRTVVYDDDD